MAKNRKMKYLDDETLTRFLYGGSALDTERAASVGVTLETVLKWKSKGSTPRAGLQLEIYKVVHGKPHPSEEKVQKFLAGQKVYLRKWQEKKEGPKPAEVTHEAVALETLAAKIDSLEKAVTALKHQISVLVGEFR